MAEKPAAAKDAASEESPDVLDLIQARQLVPLCPSKVSAYAAAQAMMEQLRELDAELGADAGAEGEHLARAFELARHERAQALADIARADVTAEDAPAASEALLQAAEGRLHAFDAAVKRVSPETRGFLGLDAQAPTTEAATGEKGAS